MRKSCLEENFESKHKLNNHLLVLKGIAMKPLHLLFIYTNVYMNTKYEVLMAKTYALCYDMWNT